MGVRGKMVDQLIVRTEQSLTHLTEERTSFVLVSLHVLHKIFVPVAVEAAGLALERTLMNNSCDVLEDKVLSCWMSKRAMVVEVRDEMLPHLPGQHSCFTAGAVSQ